MPTYHRTIIRVEVLSEGPYEFDGDLAKIHDDITDGDCSGTAHVEKTEEVDGPTMTRLLIAQGSDPGFFNLDENGNVIAFDTLRGDVSQTNCEHCGEFLPCPNGCADIHKKAI